MTPPAPDEHRGESLALIGAALVLLGAAGVMGPQAPLAGRIGVAVAAAVLALIGAWRPVLSARPLLVLVTALLGMMLTGIVWQVVMAVALLMSALVGRLAPSARPGPGALGRGRLPWAATLVTGAITPLALGLWVALWQPDLGDVVSAYVPEVPLAVLVIGGVAFALVNAALEELIWRGVMQDALGRVLGSTVLVVGLQALSFGVAHAHGVPRGPMGVLMAGSWAVLLGLLRRHAGGLLAPFVAHVVADAAIAVIILSGMG